MCFVGKCWIDLKMLFMWCWRRLIRLVWQRFTISNSRFNATQSSTYPNNDYTTRCIVIETIAETTLLLGLHRAHHVHQLYNMEGIFEADKRP
mmetsp:Transcript_19999/g.43064  ORF Transcript_19999/g.43064 Transcript_19999/m.43064 type:complete len:92 (+) Transcript_19999:139-414(+)